MRSYQSSSAAILLATLVSAALSLTLSAHDQVPIGQNCRVIGIEQQLEGSTPLARKQGDLNRHLRSLNRDGFLALFALDTEMSLLTLPPESRSEILGRCDRRWADRGGKQSCWLRASKFQTDQARVGQEPREALVHLDGIRTPLRLYTKTAQARDCVDYFDTTKAVAELPMQQASLDQAITRQTETEYFHHWLEKKMFPPVILHLVRSGGVATKTNPNQNRGWEVYLDFFSPNDAGGVVHRVPVARLANQGMLRDVVAARTHSLRDILEEYENKAVIFYFASDKRPPEEFIRTVAVPTVAAQTQRGGKTFSIDRALEGATRIKAEALRALLRTDESLYAPQQVLVIVDDHGKRQMEAENRFGGFLMLDMKEALALSLHPPGARFSTTAAFLDYAAKKQCKTVYLDVASSWKLPAEQNRIKFDRRLPTKLDTTSILVTNKRDTFNKYKADATGNLFYDVSFYGLNVKDFGRCLIDDTLIPEAMSSVIESSLRQLLAAEGTKGREAVLKALKEGGADGLARDPRESLSAFWKAAVDLAQQPNLETTLSVRKLETSGKPTDKTVAVLSSHHSIDVPYYAIIRAVGKTPKEAGGTVAYGASKVQTTAAGVRWQEVQPGAGRSVTRKRANV